MTTAERDGAERREGSPGVMIAGLFVHDASWTDWMNGPDLGEELRAAINDDAEILAVEARDRRGRVTTYALDSLDEARLAILTEPR